MLTFQSSLLGDQRLSFISLWLAYKIVHNHKIVAYKISLNELFHLMGTEFFFTLDHLPFTKLWHLRKKQNKCSKCVSGEIEA